MKEELFFRLKAALVHFLISAVVATIVASLIFAFWYPHDFSSAAGGAKLFWLIVMVDVTLGPCLTLVIFSRSKHNAKRMRDLSLVCIVQLAALGYGLHTIYLSRPIALVFEVDRFRMIMTADVHTSELEKAPPKYWNLPITGPWYLGTRAVLPNETLQSIELALSGFDTGQRPIFWQPYDDSRVQALSRARPIAELMEKYPERRFEIESSAQKNTSPTAQTLFLPMVGGVGNWVVFLNSSGDILSFEPFNGFF